MTMLSVDNVAKRCRILLSVKRGDKQRHLPAEQVWANDEDSATATVLNDYRYWVEEMYGLTLRFG